MKALSLKIGAGVATIAVATTLALLLRNSDANPASASNNLTDDATATLADGTDLSKIDNRLKQVSDDLRGDASRLSAVQEDNAPSDSLLPVKDPIKLVAYTEGTPDAATDEAAAENEAAAASAAAASGMRFPSFESTASSAAETEAPTKAAPAISLPSTTAAAAPAMPLPDTLNLPGSVLAESAPTESGPASQPTTETSASEAAATAPRMVIHPTVTIEGQAVGSAVVGSAVVASPAANHTNPAVSAAANSAPSVSLRGLPTETGAAPRATNDLRRATESVPENTTATGFSNPQPAASPRGEATMRIRSESLLLPGSQPSAASANAAPNVAPNGGHSTPQITTNAAAQPAATPQPAAIRTPASMGFVGQPVIIGQDGTVVSPPAAAAANAAATVAELPAPAAPAPVPPPSRSSLTMGTPAISPPVGPPATAATATQGVAIPARTIGFRTGQNTQPAVGPAAEIAALPAAASLPASESIQTPAPAAISTANGLAGNSAAATALPATAIFSTPTIPASATPRSVDLQAQPTPAVPVTVGPTMAAPGDRYLDGPQSPSVVIEKRAPQEVKVGKAASFLIQVRNVGKSKALNVRVHDRVPAGMTLTDATPTPNPNTSDELVWELGDLEPNQERTITMQLRPDQEGELGSVARVTFQAAASVRTISTRPALKVSQRAPEKVLIGQQLEIELEVSNPGTGEATGVVLQEDVPEGLNHPAGKQLDNFLGTLGPGQTRRQLLRMRAVKPGIVQNKIHVKGDDGLDATHTVAVEVVAPELKATLTGPTKRFLERQATYHLEIANTGTADATNVELSVQLDRGFTFIKTDFEGQYDAARHAVFWSLPVLPIGQSGRVPLTLLPVQEGNRILKTQAVADLNISTEHETKVNVDALAELTFSIADSADPIEVGGESTFEIRVANTGSRDDTNVNIAVQLPPGMELLEQANFTPQGNGMVAFPTRGLLKANEEIVLRFRARGAAPGSHLVKAIVTSDQNEVPVTKEESIKVYADQ